jgi:hypothetical protein
MLEDVPQEVIRHTTADATPAHCVCVVGKGKYGDAQQEPGRVQHFKGEKLISITFKDPVRTAQ